MKNAEAAGIDLVISGHTHAGQIFLFPYNRVLHQRGKTKVFVSEGAGTYTLRSRPGSANELNLLRLVPNHQ